MKTHSSSTTSDLPIACSLNAADLAERVALIGALGRDALAGVTPRPGHATLRFTPGAATRARLEEVVAAESRCCGLLRFTLRDEPGAIALEISAPDGGEPVLDDLTGLTGQVVQSGTAARLVASSWALAAAPLIGFTCLAILLSVRSRNPAVGIAAPVVIGMVMQLVGSLASVEALRPFLLTTPFETWHGCSPSTASTGRSPPASWPVPSGRRSPSRSPSSRCVAATSPEAEP